LSWGLNQKRELAGAVFKIPILTQLFWLLVNKRHTQTTSINSKLNVSTHRKSVFCVSINGKDGLSPVLPSCPICRATMDLICWEPFASRHITDDGKLYYCNNPICSPDKEERKQRLLPFSWNSGHLVAG